MDKTTNTAIVPKDIDDLLGYSSDCACGRKHSVSLAHVSIRNGAVDDVVPFVKNNNAGTKVLIVADFITRHILGEAVESRLKKANFQCQLVALPDGAGGRPHADDVTLRQVESVMKGFDIAVAVGSGTVNDLTKLASFNLGKPYICVATAPSMNGYTSAIAAIMQGGVKRTVECHQPYAVVADLGILAKAPHHLVASGLGDLESKPTSTADFRLGGLLNKSYYCSAPEDVVLAAEKKAADSAEGLAKGSPESISALTQALILSGISMKLAGSSSPASGGEHLISHYWDMTAGDEDRLEGWHGAQVGVATIVTATLYQHLHNVDPGTLDFERLAKSRPSKEEIEVEIKKRHGKRSEDVAKEFLSKRLDDDAFSKELGWIAQNWSSLWTGLSDVLRSPERIKQTLKSANGSIGVSDIGLTPGHLERAFIAARQIRGRYTVLDLAADLGLLEQVKDDVLKSSGCLQ